MTGGKTREVHSAIRLDFYEARDHQLHSILAASDKCKVFVQFCRADSFRSPMKGDGAMLNTVLGQLTRRLRLRKPKAAKEKPRKAGKPASA
jgi:hypothetical protein